MKLACLLCLLTCFCVELSWLVPRESLINLKVGKTGWIWRKIEEDLDYSLKMRSVITMRASLVVFYREKEEVKICC